MSVFVNFLQQVNSPSYLTVKVRFCNLPVISCFSVDAVFMALLKETPPREI